MKTRQFILLYAILIAFLLVFIIQLGEIHSQLHIMNSHLIDIYRAI